MRETGSLRTLSYSPAMLPSRCVTACLTVAVTSRAEAFDMRFEFADLMVQRALELADHDRKPGRHA